MKDGGPAFPQIQCCDEDGRTSPMVLGGMSLRDYIAIHASEEDIDDNRYYFAEGTSFTRTREAAKYVYADAMIEERER